jgi:hypothetical protein
MHQTTNDLPTGGLVVVPTNSVSSFCSSFNLYGPYVPASVVRVSAGAINVAFYQLTAQVGIFSIDAGKAGDNWDKATVYSL